MVSEKKKPATSGNVRAAKSTAGKSASSRKKASSAASAGRGKVAISARKPAASKNIPGHSRSAPRKRSTRKKSSLNMPLIMALLTVFLLGGAGVYWMFSHKADGISENYPSQQVAELNQKPSKTATAPSKAKQPGNKQEKPKPQVDLPKVDPVKPEKTADSGGLNTAPKLQAEEKVELVKPGSGKSTQGEQLPSGSAVADAGTQNVLKPAGASTPPEFETTLGGPMEQSTKLIDSYLLGVLIAKGYSGENIKIVSIERRARPKDSYYFQKLRIELPESSAYFKNPASFGQDVARGFKALQAGAEIASQADNHYVISVNGLVTHEIFLHFLKAVSPDTATVTPSGKEALLAIVIDDVGESMSAAQTLVNLDYPVTLAIWPRASNAAKCAEMGYAKGLEIMIHQPMEPMEYPNVKPGPGAVLTSMNTAEIKSVVSTNIKLVPHAVGLNNHMGSRFTQNRQGLEAVLSVMQGKNLFVLDSVTHGNTIFYELASEEGFPSQRRDIFLDVTHDKSAILHQLRKSESLAQSQGYAIAIGHPLPQTLEALKEWQKSRNKNVKIVRVQDLLKYKRENGKDR